LCGICGVVGFEDKRLLREMLRVTRHRGPSDTSTFIDKNMMLGSNAKNKKNDRIIHDENQSLWIACDGDVYNYASLRKTLEEEGHRFYTNSNKEAIVHLYEKYGYKCVEKIRGAFSFAIIDSSKHKLILARDRLGVKPIHYTITDGSLLFGSEIKSILQYDKIKREVDLQAMHDFLTSGFVPGPRTMFKGIKKLQPGHVLIYQNRKVRIKKYWDIKINPCNKMDENSCSRYLLELLKESVKIRLPDEDSIGVFLSGGVDSSTIAAIVSMHTSKPVETFTAGFGCVTDEFKYAGIVADSFGTNHHEVMIKINPMKLLPKIIWHLDEPISDPAVVPFYSLSKFAKKYSRTIFVGDGGDEIFAGYPRHKMMVLTDKYVRPLPDIVKHPIPKAASLFYKNKVFYKAIYMAFPYDKRKKFKYLSNFAPFIGNDSELYLRLSSGGFNDDEKRKLYSNRLNRLEFAENPIKTYLKNKKEHILKRMLSFDIKVELCDLMLVRVDKITMAHSLDIRAPILDHKIVEFANTLPIDLRMGKYIFKKAMSKILPVEVLKRKKQGGPVPRGINLFSGDESKEILSQMLDRFHKNEYFKYSYVQKMFKNKFRSNQKLLNLLNFEIWHKIYIEGDITNPQLTINNMLK